MNRTRWKLLIGGLGLTCAALAAAAGVPENGGISCAPNKTVHQVARVNPEPPIAIPVPKVAELPAPATPPMPALPAAPSVPEPISLPSVPAPVVPIVVTPVPVPSAPAPLTLPDLPAPSVIVPQVEPPKLPVAAPVFTTPPVPLAHAPIPEFANNKEQKLEIPALPTAKPVVLKDATDDGSKPYVYKNDATTAQQPAAPVPVFTPPVMDAPVVPQPQTPRLDPQTVSPVPTSPSNADMPPPLTPARPASHTPTRSAMPTAESKLKVLLHLSDERPKFEVRDGDEIYLKVTSERVEVKSPGDSGANMSQMKSSGRVVFVTPGGEGTCDELVVVPGTGQVHVTGKVTFTYNWGKLETTVSGEKMTFRLGATPGTTNSGNSATPVSYDRVK